MDENKSFTSQLAIKFLRHNLNAFLQPENRDQLCTNTTMSNLAQDESFGRRRKRGFGGEEAQHQTTTPSLPHLAPKKTTTASVNANSYVLRKTGRELIREGYEGTILTLFNLIEMALRANEYSSTQYSHLHNRSLRSFEE